MKKSLLLLLLAAPISYVDAGITDTDLASGLCAYYQLDEASSVRYSATSTNTLADNNTVLSATGKILDGADFERSTSESLTITDASMTACLDRNGANIMRTYSFWIKPESLSTSGAGATFFVKGNTSSLGHWLLYEPSVPGYWSWRWSDNGTNEHQCTWNGTGKVLAINTWYHVVLKWDGTNRNAHLWVDNTSYGAKVCGTGNLNNSSGPFGLADYATQYYDGVMDEFGVWERLLSTSSISDLYNSGNALQYGTSTPVGNSSSSPMIFASMLSMLNTASCVVSGASTTCSFVYSTSTSEALSATTISGVVQLVLLGLLLVIVGFAFVTWILRA